MPVSHTASTGRKAETFISLLKGGGDGVYRDGTTDNGAVIADTPPDMTVVCGTFRGSVGRRLIHSPVAVEAAIAAPIGGSSGDLRRVDIVQFTHGIGFNVKQGVEDAAPVAPAVDANSLLFAEVRCRRGMVAVQNADNGTDGWIVDKRVYR